MISIDQERASGSHWLRRNRVLFVLWYSLVPEARSCSITADDEKSVRSQKPRCGRRLGGLERSFDIAHETPLSNSVHLFAASCIMKG
jgi:hypothetical protein